MFITSFINKTNGNPRLILSFLAKGFLGLAGCFLASALTPLRLGWIAGSLHAQFSLKNITMPLIGAFNGSLGSCLTGSAVMLISFFCGTHLAWGKFLAFHIPGICAALCWSLSPAVMFLMLPAACMALFWVHPVGALAWTYSLYWFIPMLCFFLQRPFPFASRALGSTFVAHAVGSVIWLYCVPMPPTSWIALIPVVFFERMTSAAGIMIGYRVILAANALAKSLRGKKYPSFGANKAEGSA